MRKDNTIEVFFALVRGGLWEAEVQLASYGDVDYTEVMRLAQEQAVVGLVAAGLEHVTDVKVPQVWSLQFAGQTLKLEQRNKAMNQFIADLVAKMREADIYTLLVKGQGIAQCYERPNWRCSGDIDLLLDNDNYDKAKAYMLSHSSSHQKEIIKDKHFEFSLNQWNVEIHGDLPSLISKKIDDALRDIQDETFRYKNVRKWEYGEVIIHIPEPNNDIIFVFTHILKHFFRGGIGVRQICDWCRLLWAYKTDYNIALLDNRLKKMGLTSEWKAFASFAVKYLNMPVDAMPLYSTESKWWKKADRILSFIIETGNFGHNRDNSYYLKYPLLVKKAISLSRHNRDIFKYLSIFPKDALRIWRVMVLEGIAEFKKK